MRFTQEVILSVALLGQLSSEPISARILAERLHVSPFFLYKILGKLRRAGLIEVRKGPQSGVRLPPSRSRPPTLRDVLSALNRDVTDAGPNTFLASCNEQVLNLLGTMPVPLGGLETKDQKG